MEIFQSPNNETPVKGITIRDVATQEKTEQSSDITLTDLLNISSLNDISRKDQLADNEEGNIVLSKMLDTSFVASDTNHEHDQENHVIPEPENFVLSKRNEQDFKKKPANSSPLESKEKKNENAETLPENKVTQTSQPKTTEVKNNKDTFLQVNAPKPKLIETEKVDKGKDISQKQQDESILITIRLNHSNLEIYEQKNDNQNHSKIEKKLGIDIKGGRDINSKEFVESFSKYIEDYFLQNQHQRLLETDDKDSKIQGNSSITKQPEQKDSLLRNQGDKNAKSGQEFNFNQIPLASSELFTQKGGTKGDSLQTNLFSFSQDSSVIDGFTTQLVSQLSSEIMKKLDSSLLSTELSGTKRVGLQETHELKRLDTIFNDAKKASTLSYKILHWIADDALFTKKLVALYIKNDAKLIREMVQQIISEIREMNNSTKDYYKNLDKVEEKKSAIFAHLHEMLKACYDKQQRLDAIKNKIVDQLRESHKSINNDKK